MSSSATFREMYVQLSIHLSQLAEMGQLAEVDQSAKVIELSEEADDRGEASTSSSTLASSN